MARLPIPGSDENTWRHGACRILKAYYQSNTHNYTPDMPNYAQPISLADLKCALGAFSVLA